MFHGTCVLLPALERVDQTTVQHWQGKGKVGSSGPQNPFAPPWAVSLPLGWDPRICLSSSEAAVEVPLLVLLGQREDVGHQLKSCI